MTSNLLLAIYYVSQGLMMSGEFVFLNLMMLQIFQPLFNLGNFYRGWQESFIDLNELIKLFSLENKVDEKAGAKDLEIKEGNIQVTKLNFSYQK